MLHEKKEKHKQTYNHQNYMEIAITLRTYILKHDLYYLFSHDPGQASQGHAQPHLIHKQSTNNFLDFCASFFIDCSHDSIILDVESI